MDDRTSNEAHHRKGFLAEIKISRVDSQDDYDFYGSTAIKGRPGKRAAITDVAGGYKRSRARTIQSFDEHSEAISGDENNLNESKKFKTLPWKSRGKNLDKNMQPEVDQFLDQGMLYKTSRGKITSNLTRGQHEHRQHRRFQLTEHSLEYSQLLQRVCISVAVKI